MVLSSEPESRSSGTQLTPHHTHSYTHHTTPPTEYWIFSWSIRLCAVDESMMCVCSAYTTWTSHGQQHECGDREDHDQYPGDGPHGDLVPHCYYPLHCTGAQHRVILWLWTLSLPLEYILNQWTYDCPLNDKIMLKGELNTFKEENSLFVKFNMFTVVIGHVSCMSMCIFSNNFPLNTNTFSIIWHCYILHASQWCQSGASGVMVPPVPGHTKHTKISDTLGYKVTQVLVKVEGGQGWCQLDLAQIRTWYLPSLLLKTNIIFVDYCLVNDTMEKRPFNITNNRM